MRIGLCVAMITAGMMHMTRTRCPRARPWRAPDDPGHVECLNCGEPIRPAGTAWRHLDEEPAPNRPLPADEGMFNEAVDLAATVLKNLPPDADDRARAFAVADIYYWRGAFARRWVRPDRRPRRAA